MFKDVTLRIGGFQKFEKFLRNDVEQIFKFSFNSSDLNLNFFPKMNDLIGSVEIAVSTADSDQRQIMVKMTLDKKSSTPIDFMSSFI